MEVMKILNNTANLDNMFYSNNSYRAWIGLSRGSWRWSLSNTSFYKPGEMEFRRWAPGQPNAGDSGNVCTVMYSTGLWYDYDCSDSRIYPICADVRGSDVTFVSIKTSMTWTQAQSYCRAHHTDLASVRNMTENQKIQVILPGVYSIWGWIGLFRDSWKWSDGSTSSFSFWKNGQPDNNYETCVAADFSQSGTWEDWPCDLKRAFICYGPVVSKKVVKVKFENKNINDNLDLNDPAVMEAMLKQLKQKLRDQGRDDNIKLSWRKQADGKVFHKEDKKTNKRRRKRDEL
ncbi:C-type mannose receptor 2-like [Sander lucioperca]|uniref:C-type mannose receptor 2-like n=1 Tax=Sander lucioperca TaxID=283035 RepID=UPI001653E9E6|nr:C-type mannose receptor 2-like [Sander lucioperca]